MAASASQAHTPDCTLVELGFITTNRIDEALSCQMAGSGGEWEGELIHRNQTREPPVYLSPTVLRLVVTSKEK